MSPRLLWIHLHNPLCTVLHYSLSRKHSEYWYLYKVYCCTKQKGFSHSRFNYVSCRRGEKQAHFYCFTVAEEQLFIVLANQQSNDLTQHLQAAPTAHQFSPEALVEKHSLKQIIWSKLCELNWKQSELLLEMCYKDESWNLTKFSSIVVRITMHLLQGNRSRRAECTSNLT